MVNKKDITGVKARLLVNTKTRKRIDNLYDIALLINKLKNHYGSLEKVSEELVDVSTNMLNRFLSVLKLTKEIFPFVVSREIDNINFIYYIHTLKSEDQIYLSNLFIKGKINSQDIRTLMPLKKKYPNEDIKKLLEKVLESKNKKRYIIKIQIDSASKINAFKKKIENVISSNELNYNIEDNIFTVTISEYGYKKIKSFLKNNKTTLKKFINNSKI